MEGLLEISNTLLSDVKLALKDLKKNRFLKLGDLINKLVLLSEQELRLTLAYIQTSEDKIYFFDIKKKAYEILNEAREAKKYYDARNFRKCKPLLKSIKSIEKQIIKKEKYHKDEIRLFSKIAVESAVLLFIRNQVDPYVQYIGEQIEIIDYKLNHIDDYILYTIAKIKENVLETSQSIVGKKDLKPDEVHLLSPVNKLKYFLGEEINKSLEKSRIETQDKKLELTSANEKLYEKYGQYTEHPSFFPHLDFHEPYKHILSDMSYLIILSILVYMVSLHNIPAYIRQKLQTRKIKQIYTILNNRFSEQLKGLRQQIKVQYDEIIPLTNKVASLEQIIINLPEKISESLAKSLVKQVENLHQLKNSEIDKSVGIIKQISYQLGNEIAGYVQQFINKLDE